MIKPGINLEGAKFKDSYRTRGNQEAVFLHRVDNDYYFALEGTSVVWKYNSEGISDISFVFDIIEKIKPDSSEYILMTKEMGVEKLYEKPGFLENSFKVVSDFLNSGHCEEDRFIKKEWLYDNTEETGDTGNN